MHPEQNGNFAVTLYYVFHTSADFSQRAGRLLSDALQAKWSQLTQSAQPWQHENIHKECEDKLPWLCSSKVLLIKAGGQQWAGLG